MTERHWMGVADATRAFAARTLSPVELLQSLLDRIAKLDPVLNVFITLDAEAAMDQARAAEAEIAAGRIRGPLHGVPMGVKDIIDVAGLRTTGHSRVLIDNVATADAVCVARLRQAGAIMLGRSPPMNLPSAGRASTCRGRRRAIRGTRIFIPVARPPAPAPALRPGCFRRLWAPIPAVPCAIRPAPAASSG